MRRCVAMLPVSSNWNCQMGMDPNRELQNCPMVFEHHQLLWVPGLYILTHAQMLKVAKYFKRELAIPIALRLRWLSVFWVLFLESNWRQGTIQIQCEKGEKFVGARRVACNRNPCNGQEETLGICHVPIRISESPSQWLVLLSQSGTRWRRYPQMLINSSMWFSPINVTISYIINRDQ